MNSWWLALALVAYAAFATSNVLDKIIVGREVKYPTVVSFWVASIGIFSLGIFAVGLLPLAIVRDLAPTVPSLPILLVSLGAGIVGQLALLSMYAALRHDEATRVVSTLGAATTVFALVLAYIIVGERFTPATYAASGFLISGALLISFKRGRALSMAFFLAVAAGALTALQTTMIKYAYDNFSFFGSFVYMNLGGVIYAMALLILVPQVRRSMRAGFRHDPDVKRHHQPAPPLVWVLASSAIGAIGVVALNIAVKLGPVSLINGMRGIQYAIIFLFALALSRTLPKLLHEEISTHSIEQKLSAILLMIIGILFLTLPVL